MSIETFTKKVDGIICPNCTYDIDSRLKRLNGVRAVKTSYIKSEVRVEYDTQFLQEEEIENILAKMGFPVGKGRSNILADLFGLGVIVVLYFILTALTGAVHIPEAEEKMSIGLVFITGLLGGLHCIGMCGGIMLTQHNSIAYNGGRVISYSIMGLIFGAVGSYIILSMKLRSAVFIIAGALVILIGLQMWGVPFLRKIRPGLPVPCAFRGGPFIVGLLTGIMPCGMLSSMWFVAASSGSAFGGMKIMLVFCLGTCVFMLIFGLLGDVITRRYNKYILKASTILIITMGLMLMTRGIKILL